MKNFDFSPEALISTSLAKLVDKFCSHLAQIKIRNVEHHNGVIKIQIALSLNDLNDNKFIPYNTR